MPKRRAVKSSASRPSTKGTGEKPRTDTQRRILDAALGLFAEQGFDGTTTVEIAARAGVAEKTLFANFGSKERLYNATLGPATLLTTMMPEALRTLVPVFEHPPTEPRALLRALVLNRVQFAREHPREVKLLAQHLVQHPEAALEIARGFRERILPMAGPVIAGLTRMGLLRADMEPTQLARLVATQAVGYVLTRVLFRPDLPWDDEREVTFLVDALVDGLAPRVPPSPPPARPSARPEPPPRAKPPVTVRRSPRQSRK